jgi:hypothetical protein
MPCLKVSLESDAPIDLHVTAMCASCVVLGKFAMGMEITSAPQTPPS